jgi:outer membrane protein assembly factor BamB/HEAT repeat protein
MSPAAFVLILAATSTSNTSSTPVREITAAEAAADEQVLKAAGVPTTADGLTAFFRNRTPHTVERDKLQGLAKQLKDKDAAARDQASAELIGLGHTAVTVLRQAALNADDEELSNRAKKCLEFIDGASSAGLVESAARLAAVRRPAGAVEALIAYAPFADTDVALAEIENTLKVIGKRDGKPDAALTAALASPVPICRIIAARVLVEVGGDAGRKAVRALLEDPKPTVRLRAALALVERHENVAIPVLIDLLATLPPEGRKEAEEFLADLAGDWAVTGPGGNDRLAGRLRREAWRAWWRTTDGDALLDEIKARTMTDEERDRAIKLIKQLDAADGATREKAVNELVGMGVRAATMLRQAEASDQPRIAVAARQCLAAIERDGPRLLPDCAPRLLALRRPEGTVEALLAYLPFAEGESMVDEITDLIADIGCPDHKPLAAVVAALGDRVPVRRSAAAIAIARSGSADNLAGVRKLLRDPDPVVRLRTAFALAGRGEKDTVPVLVALLGELPPEQLWEAEESLRRLAGDRAPNVLLDPDRSARTAAVDAWKQWLRDHGGSVDLTGFNPLRHDSGDLIVLEHAGVRGSGRVLAINRAGKVRWELDKINFPWDAQVLARNRVLIVEQGNLVTERERDGKIVWQKNVVNALGYQRLPNGNHLFLGRQFITLTNSKGTEIFNHNCGGGWVLAADRFRDGSIAYVTYQGAYVRLDATGKEIKRFQVPFQANFGVNGGAVLPGDHVLLALPNPGKVVEYNADGKVVWETALNTPGYPTRLANGNTLVTSQNQTSLTEIDRRGRIVSEKKDLPYRPFRVIRP